MLFFLVIGVVILRGVVYLSQLKSKDDHPIS